MGTIVNIEEENRRRRRINKIKKIIICLVIVAIIVPVAISGMLAVKVVMLEKELANLRAATAKTLVATNETLLMLVSFSQYGRFSKSNPSH